MFEAHVLHLLRRYFGEFVHGLSVGALRISVWKGDVVLKDLKLKAKLQKKPRCGGLLWGRERCVFYLLSRGQIKYLCNLRRRYIHLYADSEIREIEMDLDPKVILLWRLLAHARVVSVKSKEAAQQKLLSMKSWFSFKWRGGSDEVSGSDAYDGSPIVEENLTNEEWQGKEAHNINLMKI
ncbi:hypothetical protein OROHE_021862 [Orobanche hederae]